MGANAWGGCFPHWGGRGSWESAAGKQEVFSQRDNINHLLVRHGRCDFAATEDLFFWDGTTANSNVYWTKHWVPGLLRLPFNPSPSGRAGGSGSTPLHRDSISPSHPDANKTCIVNLAQQRDSRFPLCRATHTQSPLTSMSHMRGGGTVASGRTCGEQGRQHVEW